MFENIHDKAGGSIIIISHQERILNIADKILVLAGGEIQAYGPKEEVLPGLLKGTMTNPALEQDESLECPTLLGKMK